MPLTRVSFPNRNDTVSTGSLVARNNSGFANSVAFDGPVSFNNTISLNPGLTLTTNTITSTTENTTNLFVSNQASIGTTSQLAQLTVIPSVLGRRGLTVRDISSLSSNLFRVETHTGSNIFSVDAPTGILANTTVNLNNNALLRPSTIYIDGPSYYLQVGKYLPTIYMSSSNNWNSLLISTPISGSTRVDPITLIANSTNVPLLEINGSGEIFARNSGRTPLIVRGMRSDTAYQATVNSISGNGSSVTYNTGLTAGNPFVVGSVVTITGASTAGYNGTFTVTTVNQNSFVVSNTTTGASSSATATSVGHTADLVQYLNPAGTVIGGINAISQRYTGSTTTANTTINGTGWSHDGTNATINLASASNLSVGDIVVLSGFVPAAFNGSHIVTAVSNVPTISVTIRVPNYGTITTIGQVSIPAENSIISRSPGIVGQVIRGAASQVADFMQFRNSSNNIIASFTNLGALLLPAATTSTTSLRIPHGTAPTALTDGDIWTTTSGLFVRINGATVALGSGLTNPMTTLGDIIYGAASGTPTRLAGNTTTTRNFLGQTGDGTNSAAPSWTASNGTGNVVLATSATITTPTIDTINISGAAITAALWNTTLTTGSISMGGALTSGSVNIANGSSFIGTVSIGSGASNNNKTINIGTSSTAGTTAINLGSSGGATTQVSILGPASASANPALQIGGQSGTIAFYNALAAGNYNPNVALNDKGIIFHNGSVDTGSFIIAPWSNTTSGLKITNSLVSTPSPFTSSGAVTTGGALNLNYASPTIASNNASAASIFTSTVTGITIGSSTIKTTEYPAAPSGTTSGTVTQAAQLNGYIGMPQISVSSGGRTLAASDAGRHIYLITTSGQTVTIPTNASVSFEIGTTIVIVNGNGISTTISTAGDTLRLAGSALTGNRTLASNGMCTLLKINTTEWIASGNGLT